MVSKSDSNTFIYDFPGLTFLLQHFNDTKTINIDVFIHNADNNYVAVENFYNSSDYQSFLRDSSKNRLTNNIKELIWLHTKSYLRNALPSFIYKILSLK